MLVVSANSYFTIQYKVCHNSNIYNKHDRILPFLKKNPYPKFLIAQNCIKKEGSRNIIFQILLCTNTVLQNLALNRDNFHK